MAESLSEVSLSEMSASLAKLSLQVSSCRNSGEGVCKVCPTLLRLFCETCGSGKSVKNSVSAKIRRYMDCSLPVSVEGRRYTIVFVQLHCDGSYALACSRAHEGGIT